MRPVAASNMEPTPKRKRKRLSASKDSSINATPEKIETTVSQIREDMRELEELRKKSANISGKVSGQMRSAISRVEESLVLLTAKAKEAERLKKRVEILQMENIELMAKHCTYGVRAKPEHEDGNVVSTETVADSDARGTDAGKPGNRIAESERDEFREEFRKLREFVAEEIRGVKAECKAPPVANKTYASCVQKSIPKRADQDTRQLAGPSKPRALEKRPVARENVETREKKQYNPPIIVRVCGKELPYSEMILKIKTNVNPSEFNVKVLSLRKTLSGEVELRLDGLAADVSRFEDAIRACLGQSGTLRKIQAMSFVHISDLELDITEETITRDICKACKIDPEEIKVTSIRPAFGNTKKASVKMPKKAAEHLSSTGRTTIGYVSCRCMIREFTPRCYRCGNTGHLAASCTGPDNSGKCFACGSETHRIIECPEKRKQDVDNMDIEIRRST